MEKKQLTIQGCRVQLEFPAQTPVDVHTHLSTILTELALAQAEKGGEIQCLIESNSHHPSAGDATG